MNSIFNDNVSILYYNTLDAENRILVTVGVDKPYGIIIPKRMVLESNIWIHDGKLIKCRFLENQIPSPSEIIELLKKGQNVII